MAITDNEETHREVVECRKLRPEGDTTNNF